MIEVLKQMLEALKEYHYYVIEAGLPNQSMLNKGYAAYQAGKQAIKELESQEPVAWQWLGSAHFRKKVPKNADITAWNPVYSAPQQTWVGLTDKEIKEFDTWHDNREEEVGWCNPSEIVAYIEAKLKEKNNA